jgi:hypothetical protein
MRSVAMLGVLTAVLAAPLTARAGTAFLDGHLELDLPAGMTVDGARAELPFDDGSFVMTATETYRRAGRDLRADVRADLKRQGGPVARATVETLTLGDTFDAVVVRPPLPARIADAHLVLALYIAPVEDHAIEILAFYVSGTSRGNPADWAARAEMIAGTVRVAGGPLIGYPGLLGVASHRIRIQCEHACFIRPTGQRYELRLLVPMTEEAVCRIEAASSAERPRAWSDRAGRHARWFIPIAGSADRIQVECDATTAANLAALRERLETLAVEDSLRP